MYGIMHIVFLGDFPSELNVHWANDFNEFNESTSEYIIFYSHCKAHYRISNQGFPRQIPNGHPNCFPSLAVPGPGFAGISLLLLITCSKSYQDKKIYLHYIGTSTKSIGVCEVIVSMYNILYTTLSD